MEIFLQQLINGITLGSIYGLIAIGYTMVFGIIGMVNFAHGDVFMVSAFIALIAFLILTTWLGITSIALALFIVLVVAMLFTSLVNWVIERVAYRPLRGSFRLAPLISAIGMSIFLSNFVQVSQGPRNKPIPPMVEGEFVLLTKNDFPVTLSYKQLIIWGVTAVLLLAFWYLVAKTRLGRAQRACEQDQKMAALVGVDVDRTISMPFVIAAALAAVAGTMYLMYYGVVSFSDGFVPGVKAFTAAVLGGIGSLPGAVIGGILIGLIETTRWPLLFAIVAVVGAGRLAFSLVFEPWLKQSTLRPVAAAPAGWRAVFAKWFTPFAIGFVIVYPPLVVALNGFGGAVKWIDNFGIQILIYVMLGWGLNIVVGLAGLLDLGYVAFYAVGAYSYALLAKTFGLAFWLLLPLAGILSSFWGILLGFPVLRLRGDYLAIVTLAFGEIIRIVIINWVDLTNGYAGITGIPRPTFFGIPFNADDDGFAAVFGLEFSPLYRVIFLYYVILALALLTAAVTLRLRRLPVGRAWEALREDEIACRSLGINTTNTKLTAFAMGAMFAGFAGSFFATRQGFISPESFTFLESATILSIVVLGGMGSQIGVAIAAIAMIGGTEIMRELDFLKQIFGPTFDPTQYRMLLFGFAMVLIMIWRPRGLIATREPSVFLKERKSISADRINEGHG